MIPTTLDRYLLRRALTPMAAVLISTMVAFLMERLMRSFDLLSRRRKACGFCPSSWSTSFRIMWA